MGKRMGCRKAPAEWHGFLPCDENAQRLGKIDIKIFFQDNSRIYNNNNNPLFVSSRS